MNWQAFDYDDKTTAPPGSVGPLVWIHEEYYEGVTVGYFDGFTFRTWNGSDDCHVTHWAPIEYPEAPEGAGEPFNAEDDEEE